MTVRQHYLARIWRTFAIHGSRFSPSLFLASLAAFETLFIGEQVVGVASSTNAAH